MDLLEQLALGVRATGGIASRNGEVLTVRKEDSDKAVTITRLKKQLTIEITRDGKSEKKQVIPDTVGSDKALSKLIATELGLRDPNAATGLRHLEDTQEL